MYRIPCQLEGEEQAALFRWAQFQSGKYPELDLMFHIPNGGKRGKAEAARFKAEGVKAGVPDIFFPKAKWIETKRPGGGFDNRFYCGLFVEMKRISGGTVSAEQDRWLEELRRAGYAAEVARGWEAAAAIILDYIEGRYTPIYKTKAEKEAKACL